MLVKPLNLWQFGTANNRKLIYLVSVNFKSCEATMIWSNLQKLLCTPCKAQGVSF